MKKMNNQKSPNRVSDSSKAPRKSQRLELISHTWKNQLNEVLGKSVSTSFLDRIKNDVVKALSGALWTQSTPYIQGSKLRTENDSKLGKRRKALKTKKSKK